MENDSNIGTTYLMDDLMNITVISFSPHAGIPNWMRPYKAILGESAKTKISQDGHNIVTFALIRDRNDPDHIIGHTMVSIRNPESGFAMVRKGEWDHRELVEEYIPYHSIVM